MNLTTALPISSRSSVWRMQKCCGLLIAVAALAACGDDPSVGGNQDFVGGNNGSTGGVTGLNGSSGGANGLNGANGANTTGSSGFNGTTGVNVNGSSGFNGTTGVNVNGSSGFNGTTGVDVNGSSGFNGTTGTTGVDTNGSSGLNGSSELNGSTGIGGSSNSGVPGDGSCCTDGDCVCRGDTPTSASASAAGPFSTAKYTDGYRDGPNFLGGTIYYPTDAAPPLSGVVLCPGWVSFQDSIAAWGPFLASHGIVTMIIDTNTFLDWVDVREKALLDALSSLKAENTRSGSPLQGKLSDTRFGVGGWSMGGGGTWMATKSTPSLKTGMSMAGHHVTAGGPALAQGITVPSILFAGSNDTDILGGGKQSQQAYDAIPATTPKILYEFSGVDHFGFGTPLRTGGGALGRYGLAFQKVFLEGDERYRFLLLEKGPGASDWKSNIQ